MTLKSIHRCTDIAFACRACKPTLLNQAAMHRAMQVSRFAMDDGEPAFVPSHRTDALVCWMDHERQKKRVRRERRRHEREWERSLRPVKRAVIVPQVKEEKKRQYAENFLAPCGCWRYAKPHLRRQVYLRDAGQCQFCGILLSYDECNIDHVRPWPNGKTVITNLVVICPPCNKLKGRQTIPYHLAPL